MALRLADWLGTSPDLWQGMQSAWDLSQARKAKRPYIKPLRRASA
jgi:plasmid maintenance system antidote protein VapI